MRSDERLFPEINYHTKHGYSGQPSKWFSRLRAKLELSGTKGRKDFHSFRHTVANCLKQQGYAESLIGGLLGHATGGITYERYGKEFKPESLQSAVEALSIDVL
ncbi:tyrosine-type recombinase/integrase [Halomonas sp.]|uniref:tyrosine-type recombinase/integrase n=1 Tax=Halomonas sp. TaxID=1486246 RepID=UPI00384C3F76